MTDYFGDAGYWIALIDSDDELHEPATRYERILAAENARTIPALYPSFPRRRESRGRSCPTRPIPNPSSAPLRLCVKIPSIPSIPSIPFIHENKKPLTPTA